MPIGTAAATALAGGIAGAASLGSTAGGLFNTKKAHRRNVELWKKTNKYNSPVEQMKRLKEAGLNPNLVYGNSTGGIAGDASAAPERETYRPDVEISDPMRSMLAHAQVAKTQEETKSVTLQQVKQALQ